MRAFPTDAGVSDGFRDAASTSIDVNISFGFTQRRRKDAWTDERRVPRLGACSQFAQVFRPAAEVDEAAVTVDEVRDDARRSTTMRCDDEYSFTRFYVFARGWTTRRTRQPVGRDYEFAAAGPARGADTERIRARLLSFSMTT